jgi:glycosyltransferase involved in cell wall biosynthesis
MTTDRRLPTISVCIPAYKRPQLLRRAVESVFAQTWQDWELIVSDDEDPPGETWGYLQELRRQDARVTVLRNGGPHGQVPNTNRTLLAARGAWIKPLHHDDVLRPDCLETMLSATRGLPLVVLVRCRAAQCSDERPQRTSARREAKVRALFELIEQKHVHLGMYLQDCDVGMPTQVMVHRDAIEKGALLEDVPGVVSSVDTLWGCAVLKYGDVLFVNKVLVEHHHHRGSLTASLTAEQLETEYPIVLRRVRESIDPNLEPPPFSTVLGMVKCIRAFYHLKRGNFDAALRLLGEVRSATSWLLAARWAVNQVFPGQLHAVPRIPVAAPESAASAAPSEHFGSSEPASRESTRKW